MESLLLYRGIRVAKNAFEEVRCTIFQEGLVGDEGSWRIAFYPVDETRLRIEELLAKPNLAPQDVSFRDDGPLTVCACGDEAGASFYAHRGTKGNEVAVLISFRVPIERVCVDPRDFLCTAFQLWDSITTDLVDRQTQILLRLFGFGIERYFSRVVQSAKDDQQYRIALCRLAAQDREVVLGHHANKAIIQGRYGTMFASAFVVRAPVSPDQIQRVVVAKYAKPEPFVSLDGFLGRASSCT